MKFRHLASVILTATLCSAPAVAQTITDENARITLVGAFIGANDMVATVAELCAGDYNDPPYDAEGILAKLQPYLHADEFILYTDYTHSTQYAESLSTTKAKVQRALDNIRQAQNEAAACRSLKKTILDNYTVVKAKLRDLR